MIQCEILDVSIQQIYLRTQCWDEVLFKKDYITKTDLYRFSFEDMTQFVIALELHCTVVRHD